MGGYAVTQKNLGRCFRFEKNLVPYERSRNLSGITGQNIRYQLTKKKTLSRIISMGHLLVWPAPRGKRIKNSFLGLLWWYGE